MKPVFANTATITTAKRLLIRGGTGRVALPVRCGLIVHPQAGPVLIDAGYGPRIAQGAGRGWFLKVYHKMLGAVMDTAQSPKALLAAHGFTLRDVKTVLLTHLHADHVGYLHDLPNARFITDGVTSGSLRHGVFQELLPPDFAQRQVDLRSFSQVALPHGLGPGFDVLNDASVLAVPLPGHAAGHFGLYFPKADPLLYAVDAQWLREAVTLDRLPGFPASLVAQDRVALARTAAKLRGFAAAGGTVMLCHDPAKTPYDWTSPDV